MENQLIVSNNESQDQFLAKLNQATGFSSGMPVIPQLKFNAEEGVWLKETGEKDADGKMIFDPLTESLEMNIVTTRKMVQSSFDSGDGFFSREFQDSYVELFDQNKQLVMKGLYKVLKEANPNLVFVQVLYAFVGDQPYRIKLSGSKLTKLFPYLSSFKNDNPAKWITVSSKGKRMKRSQGLTVEATQYDIEKYAQALAEGKKPSVVLFYELDFVKGDEIVDVQKIVQRVNDVNQYLHAYAIARNRNQQIISEEPPMPIEEPEVIPQDEINVENIKM